MSLWMTNTMKLVKISLRITKDIKIQDGHQLWLKIVIGNRGATINPNLEIVCNAHLIANFLSFHMRLVIVMNCGAKLHCMALK